MDPSKLQRQLIAHEGFVLKPYRDTVGKTTIGIGRNLDDVGISRAEALVLLQSDIARAVSALMRQDFWPMVRDDDVRSRVLIDMCFNMGIDGLLKFKNFLAAVRIRDWGTAATEMLDSQWAMQVGRRAVNLSAMMRGGIDVDLA